MASTAFRLSEAAKRRLSERVELEGSVLQRCLSG